MCSFHDSLSVVPNWSIAEKRNLSRETRDSSVAPLLQNDSEGLSMIFRSPLTLRSDPDAIGVESLDEVGSVEERERTRAGLRITKIPWVTAIFALTALTAPR